MIVQEDLSFLEEFEKCTLPREKWTHAAHIHMAWIYLNQFSLDIAEEKICSGIKKYNLSQGNLTGYHETVTRAFTFIIHQEIEKQQGISWEEFQRRVPTLFDRANPILLKYYRKETLDSALARETFLQPDVEFGSR